MPVGILILLVFFSAMLLCLAMIPLLQSFAEKFQLFDVPDQQSCPQGGRKVHSKPIPRLGGVAIFCAFFATNLIWLSDMQFKWSFLASVLIFLVGVADDLWSVSALARFVIQIVATAACLYLDDLIPTRLIFGFGLEWQLSPLSGLIFSVFLIVGAINALNMIDGLDGLAGGLSLIGISFLTLLYFWNRQDLILLACVSAPLVGAIIGFLKYNSHPASIFMGDGGANWIGFVMGLMMIMLLSGSSLINGFESSLLEAGLTARVAHLGIPLVSVISVLAVPICDTALVMAARVRRGQSPMKADRTHIHHSLLRLGLRHSQAVSAVYFLAVLFGIVGILPVVYPRHDLIWASYAGIAVLVGVLFFAMNLDAGSVQKVLQSRYLFRRTRQYSVLSRYIRYWENANRYALYIIFLAAPAFAGVVRRDVGFAALGAGCLIILSIIGTAWRKRDEFIDVICIATASVVLLVANNTNNMMVAWQGERLNIHWIYNSLFYGVFISSILLFLVTAKKRYFVFKSSDFLLAVLPLLLLLIPDPYKSELRLDIISLRSVVVFIALRTLAKRKNYVMTHVKGVTLVALGFVFLAGVCGLRIIY